MAEEFRHRLETCYDDDLSLFADRCIAVMTTRLRSGTSPANMNKRKRNVENDQKNGESGNRGQESGNSLTNPGDSLHQRGFGILQKLSPHRRRVTMERDSPSSRKLGDLKDNKLKVGSLTSLNESGKKSPMRTLLKRAKNQTMFKPMRRQRSGSFPLSKTQLQK